MNNQFNFQIAEPWAVKTYQEGNQNYFVSNFTCCNLTLGDDRAGNASDTLLVVPADNSLLPCHRKCLNVSGNAKTS